MAYGFNDDKSKVEVYSKDEFRVAEKSVSVSGANGEGTILFTPADFGLSEIDPDKVIIISVMQKKSNQWATAGGWNPTGSMGVYGNYPPSFPFVQILSDGTIKGYVCKAGASTASETIRLKIVMMVL